MKRNKSKKRTRYYIFVAIVLFAIQGMIYLTHFINSDDLPFYNVGSFF